MSLLEDHTASFIVRIWRERGEGLKVSQEWRGAIEHVQSGHRNFFRDLSEIANFMKPHLEQIGIEAPLRFWDVITPDLHEAPPHPVPPIEVTAPARVARAAKPKR